MGRRGSGVLAQIGRALAVAAIMAVCPGAGGAQSDVGTKPVDTALIVAVDVSNSVDDERYRLQMEGIAQALEDREVIEAIVRGAEGGILFSLVTWADRSRTTLPWMRISSVEEARAVAQRVRKLRRESGEFTCMTQMMRKVSDKVVPQIPVEATHIVLDVSGDGRDNCNAEEPITAVRDELVRWGVTVNGLPILEGDGEQQSEVPQGAASPKSYLPQPQTEAQAGGSLEEWFRQNVKGGAGSFVLPAEGYGDFGRAIRQKFVLEISRNETSTPLTVTRRMPGRGSSYSAY